MVVPSAGPEAIWVSGAVRSMVQVRDGLPWSGASSVARMGAVGGPSASPRRVPKVRGDSAENAPASSGTAWVVAGRLAPGDSALVQVNAGDVGDVNVPAPGPVRMV